MGITSDMKFKIEEKYEKAFRNYFPKSTYVDVQLKRHTLQSGGVSLNACLVFTYELNGDIHKKTILQDNHSDISREPFNLNSFEIEFYRMIKLIKGVNNRVW